MAVGKDRIIISWTFAVVVLVVCFVTGTQGKSVENINGPAEASRSGFEFGTVIGGVACLAVLVAVIALCVEKRVHVELMERGPPFWTRSLVFKQEFNGGLSSVSEGMNNLSPFHIIRDRLGHAVTDGARWDVGFTEGKHVFEVVWPVKKNRGTNSSIGVGSMQVPLKKQGRLSLVGHHSQSWGYDLSSRKMVHANKRTGSFQKQLPDRFFLYVDMDGGKIGIGEDVKQLGRQALFYGYQINGIRMNKENPMYLMVGMCSPREEVQIYYIGTAVPQGGFDLIPPVPIASAPYDIMSNGAQPQMGQQPMGQMGQQPTGQQDQAPQPVVVAQAVY